MPAAAVQQPAFPRRATRAWLRAAGGAGAGVAGAGGGAIAAASCANIDATLPPEPVIPPACATLQAALAITPGTPPTEANLDTARIQSALANCAAGEAVKLTTDGANNAFVTGPLNIPSGVSLWIDAGTTLFGTRDPAVYGQAASLIGVHGVGSGIYGEGTIDGQGASRRSAARNPGGRSTAVADPARR